MRTIEQSRELAPGSRRVCAAIGVFDGIHLGHQQVIRRALVDSRQFEALSVVVTFDRHPSSVVAPSRTPPMLYTNEQKQRTLEQMGVDVMLMIPFTPQFSQVSGEDFIRGLARDFVQLRSLSVGSEFAFGHRRSGNVALLQKLGGELGFVVHGISAVALDGEIVSSTRIRQAIQEGRLDAADEMLGRAWSLAGSVVRGDQRGRTLGFPTANLDVHGLVLPPAGVYVAHALVTGRPYRAVLNIGVRPTVADGATSPRVEVHLLGFEGDLYGATMEVFIITRLREERRFASLEELRAQIARDVDAAARLFD
jgi:riboflavin kinase/FMN adenylyltransferase